MVTLTRVISYITIFSFAICFAYQLIYFHAANKVKKRGNTIHPSKPHNYAVLISARNEENVIPNLIKSIKGQSYDLGSLDIYVIADNCTDNTARVAKRCGARVIKRFDKTHVGKGYALGALVRNLMEKGLFDKYDGYFIFDADNLLDVDYVSEINKVFGKGYPIVTGLRSSTNFNEGWVAASSGLWFLHDSQLMNRGRMEKGTSCMVNGTGYVVSREFLKKRGGWNFFGMTEDVELNADCIANNEIIGYCERAVFYDEQPVSFKVSCTQRVRWVKGYFDVYKKYFKRLFDGMKTGYLGFSAYDMLMPYVPAFSIFFASITAYVTILIYCLATGDAEALDYLGKTFTNYFIAMYILLFIMGVNIISEQRHITGLAAKSKIKAALMMPIFLASYIPIGVYALFKNVEWKPIEHHEITAINPAVDGRNLEWEEKRIGNR